MSEEENQEAQVVTVKYYAGEGKISTAEFEGCTEISANEYAACIDAISNGQEIAIRSEGLRFLSADQITVYAEDGDTLSIAENEDVPEGYATEKPPLSDAAVLAGIKVEAARRIQASGHDWIAIRKITTGEDVPVAVINYAAAVRTASGVLEGDLPQDFYDDSHWPEVIA